MRRVEKCSRYDKLAFAVRKCKEVEEIICTCHKMVLWAFFRKGKFFVFILRVSLYNHDICLHFSSSSDSFSSRLSVLLITLLSMLKFWAQSLLVRDDGFCSGVWYLRYLWYEDYSLGLLSGRRIQHLVHGKHLWLRLVAILMLSSQSKNLLLYCSWAVEYFSYSCFFIGCLWRRNPIHFDLKNGFTSMIYGSLPLSRYFSPWLSGKQICLIQW